MSSREHGSLENVTQLLAAVDSGDAHAADELLPLVYAELRRLAAHRLAHEPSGQTLQATALVHEAYVRLVDTSHPQHWQHRGHFFAAAAEAMRRILIENARRKQRLKHGGPQRRVELREADLAIAGPSEDILDLDDALRELAAVEPRKAELVKLRYFAGLSEEDAADVLGISRATAARWWAYARAWLYERLRSEHA